MPKKTPLNKTRKTQLTRALKKAVEKPYATTEPGKRTGIPGVTYSRRRGAMCPFCKRSKGSVLRTLPWEGETRIRYHNCRRCGGRFKSIESL